MSDKKIVKCGGFGEVDLIPLEECLALLEKYGRPHLSKSRHKNGWHVRIDVFVVGKGVSFEVMSDFYHKTPKIAANVCYAQLLIAMKKIAEVVPTQKEYSDEQ